MANITYKTFPKRTSLVVEGFYPEWSNKSKFDNRTVSIKDCVVKMLDDVHQKIVRKLPTWDVQRIVKETTGEGVNEGTQYYQLNFKEKVAKFKDNGNSKVTVEFDIAGITFNNDENKAFVNLKMKDVKFANKPDVLEFDFEDSEDDDEDEEEVCLSCDDSDTDVETEK